MARPPLSPDQDAVHVGTALRAVAVSLRLGQRPLSERHWQAHTQPGQGSDLQEAAARNTFTCAGSSGEEVQHGGFLKMTGEGESEAGGLCSLHRSA